MFSLEVAGFFLGFACNATTVGFLSFFRYSVQILKTEKK